MKHILNKVRIIGLLVLLVSILLLNGCTGIAPEPTATVIVSLDVGGFLDARFTPIQYEVTMDGQFKGFVTEMGSLSISNVPLGSHTFTADDGISCNGFINQTIVAGTNYVIVPITCGLMPIMEE